MINSLTASSSSMLANSRAHEIISRNLANASTTGYRKGVPVFDGFKNILDNVNSNVAPTIVAGAEEQVDFSEGKHVHTGRALDLALHGDGFFVLQDPKDPSGHLYTRKGHFTLDKDGRIVNSVGLPLLSSNGSPIKVPPGNGSVVVKEDGTVGFKNADTGEAQSLGELMKVDFPKPYRLERTNFTAFKEAENSETAQPAEEAKVKQGYLEEANINLLGELVSMIAVMRSFEADQRTISSTDQTLKDLINSV